MFPGETIRTEMWRDGAVVSFRARVVERDVVALNNGRARSDRSEALPDSSRRTEGSCRASPQDAD